MNEQIVLENLEHPENPPTQILNLCQISLGEFTEHFTVTD